MNEFRCKSCDAVIDLSTAHDGVVECRFCHNAYTVPTTTEDVRQQLLIAENELDRCDFDSAYGAYAKAIAIEPSEPESYFGLALASFKVQYIRDTKDPKKKRLQPICHEASDKRFADDKNYRMALRLASPEQKVIYLKRAEEIDAINAEFYRLKKSGLRYDCFICVKVTNEDGGNTQDSYEALKLYNYLKKLGYLPFYSEQEMQGRVGVDYAALILYALHTSECMLVVCTDEDYLLTPWVKNEYTQFGELIEGERKDSDAIAVVFKGKPIQNLPGRKGKIQGVDLGNASAYVEIAEYVDNHTPEARARKLEAEERIKAAEKEKQRKALAQEKLIAEMKAQLAALAEQTRKNAEQTGSGNKSDPSKEMAALKAELAAQLEAIKNTQAQATKVTFDGSLSGDALLEAMEQAKRDKAAREEAERKERELRREEERRREAEERKRKEEEFKKDHLYVGETLTVGKFPAGKDDWTDPIPHDESSAEGMYDIVWEVRKSDENTAVLVTKNVLVNLYGDRCDVIRDPKTGSSRLGVRTSPIGAWIKTKLLPSLGEEERTFFAKGFSLLSQRDVEDLFPEKSTRIKRCVDAFRHRGLQTWWLSDWTPPQGFANQAKQYRVKSDGNIEERFFDEWPNGVVLKVTVSSKRADIADLIDPVKIKERENARRAERQEAERKKLEEERAKREAAEKKREEKRLAREEEKKRLRAEAEVNPTVENFLKEDFDILHEHNSGNGNDEYILMRYKGNGERVTVPSGVTHIEARAFENHTEIKSIAIPKSFIRFIKKDYYGAYDYLSNPFWGCNNLSEISVEEGAAEYRSEGNCLIHVPKKILVCGNANGAVPKDEIKEIGSCAFGRFDKIKEIVIPDCVETLGNGAFVSCTSLASVTMPKALKKYIKTAFDNNGKKIKFTFTK